MTDGAPTGSGARLDGKVAVVTGASKGIGVAIARRLHADGATVALLARSVDRLEGLADELGDRCLVAGCDVGDPSSVDAAFARVDEHVGRVDALVNNAGTIQMSLLADSTDETILQLVSTNLLGPMYCSRAAIPLLEAAGGGDIVNISSRAVGLARPHLSVYAATKGGLETFTKTLAAELRPGIRVSAIRVGPTASEPEVTHHGASAAEVTKDWVARGGPAPEAPAPPESVADAVAFILGQPPGQRIPVVHVEPR